LAELPDGLADLVLTSPPYFRLRDYQVRGQLGLEAHVDQWVGKLRAAAHEAARVLVPTGSFWLNVADTYANHPSQGAAKKSLLLGPERLALLLLEDGWLLRNKIVWQKANPMPSSVTDRLTASWEALYVFVRQPDYYFNLNAVREPHQTQSIARAQRAKRQGYRRPTREPWRGPNGDDASGLSLLKAQGRVGHPLGKNPGDVWRIASSSFRDGHHATFPVALADRAISAGCPEYRCSRCLQPWHRPAKRHSPGGMTIDRLQPSCACGAARAKGLVLDPFMGAGTTAVAAEHLRRDWLGIELNPRFARMAERRIEVHRAHPP
jgi:DNA modification methylase